MHYIFAIAFALVLASSANAAEAQLSKAGQSAVFRVKVAECKAQAKSTGVKANDSAWFAFMGSCVDKTTVTVASK